MSAGGRPQLRKIGFCHIEHKGHKVSGSSAREGGNRVMRLSFRRRCVVNLVLGLDLIQAFDFSMIIRISG